MSLNATINFSDRLDAKSTEYTGTPPICRFYSTEQHSYSLISCDKFPVTSSCPDWGSNIASSTVWVSSKYEDYWIWVYLLGGAEEKMVYFESIAGDSDGKGVSLFRVRGW